MLCWPSGYARTFDCLKGAGCGFDIRRRHHFSTFLTVEQQHKWPSPATAPAGARLQKQKKSVPSLMNCFYRFSFYRFPFHQMKPACNFFCLLSLFIFLFPFLFFFFFHGPMNCLQIRELFLQIYGFFQISNFFIKPIVCFQI